MALFFKKPETASSAPLYTLGLNKSLLIIGLGNIGTEYANTRHNIGFQCIDNLAKALEIRDWSNKKDLKAQVATGKAGDKRIVLAKPTTMMNLSGDAVQLIANFYKINTPDVLVIHDDLDIEFGQIRTRVGGGSAGHNGIKSITNQLGEDYGRVRIGIKAETKMPAEKFVLAKFTQDEQEQIPNLLRETSAIITEYIYGGELPHDTRSFL